MAWRWSFVQRCRDTGALLSLTNRGGTWPSQAVPLAVPAGSTYLFALCTLMSPAQADGAKIILCLVGGMATGHQETCLVRAP